MAIDFPFLIDVRSVQDLRDAGEDFLLLDCREPDEYATVHIAGAKLLPMHETAGRIVELESWRNRRIIVHCHHGKRSQQVAEWLRGQGFAKVQSMTGGIHLWALLIDTSLPRY